MKLITVQVRNLKGIISKSSYRVETIDELYNKVAGLSLSVHKIIEVRELSNERYHLSPRERMELFESLGSLSSSGLKIQDALEVAIDLPFKGELAKVILVLNDQVQKGMNFSQAVMESIKNLPPLISGMLAIGERSGQLDLVLSHCVTYLRLMQGLREKIVSASVYPCFVIGLLIIGVSLLLLVFIPNLQAGLGSMNSQAASIGVGFERIKILLSILLLILSIPISLFVIYRIDRIRGGKLAAQIEQLLLAIPVIGTTINASLLFSLAFTLEVLTTSGVSLQESLYLSRTTLWSVTYQNMLIRASEDVRNGLSLSMTFTTQSVVPTYFSRWVQIAERTGRVGQVFGELRIYYQRNLDLMIARITNLVEPTLIAIVGLILLAVISAVVVPIFSMYQLSGQ